MVSVSKKEARKAAKGQVKAATSIPIPKKSALKQPVAEEEESGDEEEWESEDEDEENGGVSEAGMRRLMELVSEEDLDDYERAQLADEDEDEDDEDEEASGDEDEDEDEDDVLDDEDVGELGGEGSDEEDDEENEDMEGVSDMLVPIRQSG
jgi:rRNA-processing protein EBP2